MARTCGSCGGSGRYVHASGNFENCHQCGGLGSVYDGTSSGVRRGAGGAKGGGSGCAIALAFVLGMILCATVIVGYIASSELFWRHWANADILGTNWLQIWTFIIASSAVVATVSRFWGAIAGGLVGLIPAMPMMMAINGRLNIWYIVTGDEFIDPAFTAGVSTLGIVAINVGIALLAQKLPNAPGLVPNFTWLKSTSGVISTAVMATVVAVSYFMMRSAVIAW